MDRRSFIQSGLLGATALLCGSCSWRGKLHRDPLVDSVIFLTMSGGPSHIDSFDYKPDLFKQHGKRVEGFESENGQIGGSLLKPLWNFSQHGDSGNWISDLFPHAPQIIDDLCFINSMTSKSDNHGFALNEMNSGVLRSGAPHLGSWIDYALGANDSDLPRSVILTDPKGLPRNGSKNWSFGFLPSQTESAVVRGLPNPIPELILPESVTPQDQNQKLRLLQKFHQLDEFAQVSSHAERSSVFSQALASREKLLDCLSLEKESASTLQLYGIESLDATSFAHQVLRARRLREQGVKYIQVYSGGKTNEASWDNHQDMNQHRTRAEETDLAITALVKDLKQRGLWTRTLIVWGGEFGRLPVVDEKAGSVSGRGHNKFAFTYWLAGGPMRGGLVYGKSDEIGLRVTEDPVQFGDLHATILHLLGINHLDLAFQYRGSRMTLTNNSHQVLRKLFFS
jgi:hypothetical protein